MKPAGVSDSDIYRISTAPYDGITSTSAIEDCGRAFKFQKAWKMLKDHPKIFSGSEKRVSGSTMDCDEANCTFTEFTNDSYTPENNISVPNSAGRLVVRGKAKEKLSKKASELIKMKLTETAVQLQKETSKAFC